MPFSTSNSKGAPNDAAVTAGGVSGSRLKLLNSCHLPCLPSDDDACFSLLREDFLIDDVRSRIKLISLDG